MFFSRELGLMGLAISFVGTLGMFWGGLESFIVVKTTDSLDKSDTSILFAQEDYRYSKDINYELVLTDIAGVNRHILVNKIGKGALAFGLALQLIALWIDP